MLLDLVVSGPDMAASLCTACDVCVCMFWFVLVWGLVLWIDLSEVSYMRRVLKCAVAFELATKFDRPEVTLCV